MPGNGFGKVMFPARLTFAAILPTEAPEMVRAGMGAGFKPSGSGTLLQSVALTRGGLLPFFRFTVVGMTRTPSGPLTTPARRHRLLMALTGLGTGFLKSLDFTGSGALKESLRAISYG